MSQTIDQVYRDFKTMGVPTSGDHWPDKAEIRRLLKQIAGGTAGVGDFRGQWFIDETYVASDIVEYGGSIWYALQGSIGVTPVEGAYWTLFLPGASVADGSLTTAKYQDKSITEAKLADGVATPHLFGLTLSNNAINPTTHFNVAAGSCSDLITDNRIKLNASLTKRINATWSAGAGQGALDSGSVAANTTYYVFAIKNLTTLATDILASTSPTAPSLPSGWAAKRRIGFLMTNASSHIIPFVQTGGWFHWVTPTNTGHAGVAVGTTAANVTLSQVPVGIKTEVDIFVSPQGGMTYFALADPDRHAATIMDSVQRNNGVDGVGGQVRCYCSASAQVSIFANDTGTVNIFVRGVYDGRDTYV